MSLRCLSHEAMQLEGKKQSHVHKRQERNTCVAFYNNNNNNNNKILFYSASYNIKKIQKHFI